MKVNKKIVSLMGIIIILGVVFLLYFNFLRSFQVDFEPNGGTWIATEQVRIKNQVIEPPKPIREGYIFEGWYLDDKLYDFKTPVTQDLTLVAHWKEKEK